MVPIITDEKRQAIAVKLADIVALQHLAISNEETLMKEINDPEIRKRISDFLTDDRKNLTIIENTIIQYGIKGEPSEGTLEKVKKTRELMESSKLSAYDKVFEHELIKHQLTMTGITIHKAAQVVGADIDAAITPLNTVNFENRAHQEQLKGVLEVLGTRELTGKDPDQGLWARVQDSLAALTGVFGSVVSRGDSGPDMKVTDIVRMDHAKVNTLFGQIQSTDNPQEKIEYFNQLYSDLNAHSEAEEETWYAALRKFDDSAALAQNAYSEQDALQALLEQIKTTGINSPEFDSMLMRLQADVQKHVNGEESDLFAKLRQHFSDEQLRNLGKEFQMAKSRYQDLLKQKATV